jgi:hypothetical protein
MRRAQCVIWKRADQKVHIDIATPTYNTKPEPRSAAGLAVRSCPRVVLVLAASSAALALAVGGAMCRMCHRQAWWLWL